MASSLSNATLNVTLTESIVLNGSEHGSKKKMSISGVNEISKRIMTCTTSGTQIYAGGSSVSYGTFATSDVKYVRITNLDQSLDPARLEYQIYNENDLNSKEHSGFVDDPDVYGVVGSNVSFHDRDAGYSVTQGDYFVIDSDTIGSNDGTWSMKLIDQSSNRLLFDVKLTLIED